MSKKLGYRPAKVRSEDAGSFGNQGQKPGRKVSKPSKMDLDVRLRQISKGILSSAKHVKNQGKI